MSYENDPSTRALATRCLICGRALRDAVSVEAGIGPECRANIGYAAESGRDRSAANKAIHRAAVAAERGDWEELNQLCSSLIAEGFPRVAEIVQRRFPEQFVAVLITLSHNDSLLRVQTRFHSPANRDFYQSGATWNRDDKCRYIANTPEAKSLLWEVLKKHFPGDSGIGPDGRRFTIPPAN